MMGDSNSTELLLTDDPQLSDHVYSHLKEQYPDIKVFHTREGFENFVRDLGDKEYEITPYAIGAAFKNGVFIDTGKAKQSTPIHEYAHIYWDMIGDIPEKAKLMDLYQDEGLLKSEIEEAVIHDIGIAGTDIMQISLKKGKLNRFLDALRNFWRFVKKFLGKYTKSDFVYDMAKSVLLNQHNINPLSDNGANAIKYMVEKDGSMYEQEESFDKVGGKTKLNITGAIKMIKGEDFDPSIELDKSINRLRDRLLASGKSEGVDMTQMLEEKGYNLKNIWENAKHIGNAIDDVMSTLFEDKEVSGEVLDNANNVLGKNITKKIIEETGKIKDMLNEKHPDSKLFVQRSHYSEAHDITYRPDVYVVDDKNKIFVYDIYR